MFYEVRGKGVTFLRDPKGGMSLGLRGGGVKTNPVNRNESLQTPPPSPLLIKSDTSLSRNVCVRQSKPAKLKFRETYLPWIKKYSYLFLTAKLQYLRTRAPAGLVSNDVTATHNAARTGEGSRETTGSRWRADSYAQIETQIAIYASSTFQKYMRASE